jgi:hypothetical protein
MFTAMLDGTVDGVGLAMDLANNDSVFRYATTDNKRETSITSILNNAKLDPIKQVDEALHHSVGHRPCSSS